MLRNLDVNQVNLGDAYTILDSITDAFFSLNANWEFSYVNRRTEEVLGRKATELLHRRIWDVFPGTVGSEFESMYRKAAEESVAVTFCSYYPDHARWYDVNVYPAHGGLAVYFRDVTTRMQEASRREALLALSDIVRDLTSPEEIIYKVAEFLGKALDVSRVGYGALDELSDTMQVIREWNAPGIHPLDYELDLRDFGSFIDDLKAGQFVSINNVDEDRRTAEAATALRARSAGSFVNVPIIEKNQLVAVIYVNHAAARHWQADELAFIKEVAERARTASERQRNQEKLARLAAYSEQRRRLYETFLENSPDLAYVFDLNHRFVYANKVLLKMWGRTWNESIGKNCLELGYEPWHAEMHDREIEQVIASKQSIRGEVPFDGAFGRRIYDYIFVPVLGPDGEVEAIAGTTRDITERKLAEEALVDASRRKDEFLAMLAHELRNPLAPISAAAEALARFSLDEKTTRSSSQVILRQVKHMTALVDDLLDVSRVTRGLIKLDKVTLDLKSVVYNAVEQVRPFIEARRHHLLFDLGAETAYVLGDQKRLVQIVTNLLNNAAKYTPEDGAINIKINIDATTLVLSVEDNGIGIPADLQHRVFDLFTQAERTSDRTQGGLGIGLALVKNLVEMHGGTVTCFSDGLNQGSRFTVTLPRHLVTRDDASPVHEQLFVTSVASKPLRILVVDDNVDAAMLLAQYLEASGHELFIANSSQQALERARREKPAVCILDIGLPEIDGNELARRLRAEQETAHALLIAVTGYGQEKDKLAAKNAGFDELFVKPVSAGKLAGFIEEHRKCLSASH